MSARASDALARMRSAATTPTPRARQERVVQQTRPVRITLDLDPARHRALRQFALDQRAQASRVLRALIDLLETDPTVTAAIIDRLARERQERRSTAVEQ
jgi:hypothetical protein